MHFRVINVKLVFLVLVNYFFIIYLDVGSMGILYLHAFRFLVLIYSYMYVCPVTIGTYIHTYIEKPTSLENCETKTWKLLSHEDIIKQMCFYCISFRLT